MDELSTTWAGGGPFTHVYDPSVPIFRVAILVTPLAALPLDGALRAMGHTRYLFRAFLGRLLLTVPAVLIGLNLFGMVVFDIFSAVLEGVTPCDIAFLAPVVVHGSVRKRHLRVQVRQVNHNVGGVRVQRRLDVRLEHGS